MDIKDIEIDKIRLEERLWEVNQERIQPLADSINTVGLINPITVLKELDGYILIAGEHRLLAYKYNKKDTIPAIVHLREHDELEKDKARCVIIEADENLLRRKPDGFEEGYILAKRKEAYETLYPESTKQAKQKLAGKENSHNLNNVTASDKMTEPVEKMKSFAEDTAQKMGISERAVNRIVRRGTILTEKMGRQVEKLKLNNAAIDNIIKGKDDDKAREAAKIYIKALEEMAKDINEKELSKKINAECRSWTSCGYDISEDPVFYAESFERKYTKNIDAQEIIKAANHENNSQKDDYEKYIEKLAKIFKVPSQNVGMNIYEDRINISVSLKK